jgi:hypothetical protein
MLATLSDSHTGITKSKEYVYTPAFEGLYGGGLWIATERGRILLRALMDGHPLANDLVPGAELLTINGRPARIVHRETCARLREWSGWSSQHFLDARLSFQFFRFDGNTLPATFLNPDGSVVEVEVPRWGPGGRAISRKGVTMPAGLEVSGTAISAKLSERIGYIRILGSMNQATEEEFSKALDALQGVAGILLDCRGMGGGSDYPAWAMAGRFYSEKTPQGSSRELEPTGSWQFEGPVVLLQDERMLSSAETFTWAMTETGRALPVGRPTGGGTIIPRVFDAPSGLFSFRMGCYDRPTPIKAYKPEGKGSPPEIYVPYEPVLLERFSDPCLAVARDALLLLVNGAPRNIIADYYGGILGADPERVRSAQEVFAGLALPPQEEGFDHVTHGILEPMIDWQIRLCDSEENPMPDFAGAAERLEALAEIATILFDDDLAARARQAPEMWGREIEAQQAYEALAAKSFPPPAKGLRSFLGKYADTRYGRAAKIAFD